MNGLALCAGAGGLELGLRLAFGDAYRTVGYIEREAYAAACLVARMEDSPLDRAPVWDDLTTFDGRPWRGLVDLVSAGFPCQPFSVAGKQKGTEDARWLWPDIARIIEEVEPSVVFLENVPGLIRIGLHHVLEDLARLGFNAEWDRFRASDVGAPHRRERVFILAYREGGDGRLLVQSRGSYAAGDEPVGGGEEVADASSGGLGELRDASNEGRGQHHDGGDEGMADASDDHGRGRVGEEEAGTRPDGERRRGSPGGRLYPPGPGELDEWRRILEADPDLAPAVESDLRRGLDGPSARLDRLRLCGNGVVPDVAALAWRVLKARMAE